MQKRIISIATLVASVLLFAGTASAATATTLTVANVNGTYGGTVTLTATLTQSVGGTPISGKTIIFTLNNIPVGTAVTQVGTGVATLNNIPTLTTSAGTHTNFVKALYLGGGTLVGDNGSADLHLNQKVLTITGITASSKTYDGSPSAAIDTTNAHRSGVVLLDQVTLNTSGAVGTFDNANPGLGKTVTITGLTLGGSAANNYTIGPVTTTANITVACNTNSTFDNFTPGSVNGQFGWGVTGPFDQAVVANNVFPTFGCQSLRISDSITSGSFGDQIFSPSLTNEAGETDALNNGVSGGVRQNHFEAQFDLGSILPNTLQPGMHLSVSPDRGDGARMSYLRFEDHSASDVYTADTAIPGHPAGSHYDEGINVFFDDVTDVGHVTNGDSFNETEIATLDRTQPHTIKFDMTFVDGPDNDIVKIYIDGNLAETGTSWEDYYRFDTESNPGLAQDNSRTVDSLLFRESGDADVANAGNGFLIDNMVLTSSTQPGNLVINSYACPMGTSVTRAVNGVGLTIPTGCVAKAGTTFGYVHGTQADANSPYPELSVSPFTVAGTTDGSGMITNNLAATGRYLVAETDGSGNQLPAASVLGLYCIGDGDMSATNDNQELTFVPANGAVHCVSYDTFPLPAPTPVSPLNDTATSTANQQLVDWTDVGDALTPTVYFYEVSNSSATNGDGSFVTPVYSSSALSISQISTPNTPDAVYYWHVYAQDNGGNKSPWSITQKFTVQEPVVVAPATPDGLAWTSPTVACGGTTDSYTITANWNAVSGATGYNYSVTSQGEHHAGNPWTTTVGTNSYSGAFTEGTGIYTFMVQAYDGVGNTSGWSAPCSVDYEVAAPPAPTYTVTIDKFIDGEMATVGTANNSSFPMTATWNNLGADAGTAPYALAPLGFNSANAYEAVTELMNAGSSYSTSEVTGGAVVGATCASGAPYALDGYKVGSNLAGAEESAMTTDTPSFTNLTQNEVVIVVNEACAPAPVTPTVTTGAATFPSDSDATLNGITSADAIGHSFWVSLSGPIDTSTSDMPVGVFSTPDFHAISAGPFSASLASLATDPGVTTNGHVAGNLPGITPSTTYHYVAWANVPGQGWIHGADQTVMTTATPPAPLEAVNQTVNLTNGNAGPITLTHTGGSGTITYYVAPAPTKGALSSDLTHTGIFTYTPQSNYAGPDSFQFQVSDDGGATYSDPATVTITDADTIAPVITLAGANPATITSGDTYLDPGASVTDNIDTGLGYMVSVDGGATTTPDALVFPNTTVGTHTIIFVATDSAGNQGFATRTVNVTAAPEAPAPTPTPTVTSFSVGGGNGPISGSFGGFIGQVLGASTSTVPQNTVTPTTPISCSALLSSYMAYGKKNDSTQVTRLQQFLKDHGYTINVNGFFDLTTRAAVKVFQTDHKTDVLIPWGLLQPTGIVFKTTLYEINKVDCPTLQSPFPKLF